MEYKQHVKSLVLLGLPIIIGQLGNIVTGLADTVMVGQHSTDELAAASFVNNVINAFIILGTGFSFNYTPIIGEHIAINKRIAIGGWLKNSLMANTTTTALILLVLFLIYINVGYLGQPEELMPLIRPYYLVLMSSVLFVMLSNTFRQFVEGIMDASISMWVLTLVNAINIAGNYVLIYGKCGFPELGLLGAGISTLLSRIIMLLLFVAVFVRQEKYKPFRKGFLVTPFRKAYWKRLNLIGWPIAFQQGIEAATFCITTIMIGWLGGMALAAHQVAIAVSTVSFTIYLGLGSAVAIRTSMFKGLQDWRNVRRVTLAGVGLAVLLSVTLSLLLYLCCDTIGSYFTDDEAVLQIVAILLPILIAYQFGDSIQIVLANALRGLSDVTSIMVISFVAYFIIAIPAGYAIAFFLDKGIAGIWLSYPIGFTCSVILLGMRAYRVMKR
ncbi:MATE family efflux transporter [uncultured Bacteroides sp.]|jgi:MATE family multidrug resistance protein|uniref:MATE family efflux transporter n=1 Tax=uncultured Bacteroides sp. TaxID=162156 RepID=UPI0025D50D80|nr:MATE family efflux transporter [uncultured Bacteroides sp.]